MSFVDVSGVVLHQSSFVDISCVVLHQSSFVDISGVVLHQSSFVHLDYPRKTVYQSESQKFVILVFIAISH